MHACKFRRRSLFDCFDFIQVESPTGVRVFIWRDRVLAYMRSNRAEFVDGYAEINSFLADADGQENNASGKDWNDIQLSSEQLATLKIFAKLFGHITTPL